MYDGLPVTLTARSTKSADHAWKRAVEARQRLLAKIDINKVERRGYALYVPVRDATTPEKARET